MRPSSAEAFDFEAAAAAAEAAGARALEGVTRRASKRHTKVPPTVTNNVTALPKFRKS